MFNIVFVVYWLCDGLLLFYVIFWLLFEVVFYRRSVGFDQFFVYLFVLKNEDNVVECEESQVIDFSGCYFVIQCKKKDGLG